MQRANAWWGVQAEADGLSPARLVRWATMTWSPPDYFLTDADIRRLVLLGVPAKEIEARLAAEGPNADRARVGRAVGALRLEGYDPYGRSAMDRVYDGMPPFEE